MDYTNENVKNELGSAQIETFALITLAKIKSDEDESIRDEDEILTNEEDEEIMPSLKAKRNPWNSATFDSDDFFAGTIPA